MSQGATLQEKETAEFDVAQLRREFPILSRKVYDKPLVYLDSAASAQKPKVVLEAVQEVLSNEYANVHRGLHYLSNEATTKFEEARLSAARFLNASSENEIVFTSGATDAINLVADSFGAGLEAGDEIILSVLEHHSNIVPWHYLRERKGVVLKWVDISDSGELKFDQYKKLFSNRTKLVALTHMSNALGILTPAKEIVRVAHEKGVPVLLDGCQGAVHLPVDVQDLDVDFYVFSGHKLYGPTGIGVLYGKSEHLQRMRPYRGGGEMIGEVTQEKVTYAEPPHKFEAGTPPIAEAIGLGAALEFVMSLDREAVLRHENALRDYATQSLRSINSLKIFGDSPQKGSILSFALEGIHPHDLSTIIDRSGVAIRAGHHCAQPLMERLGVTATARASFALYNTQEDVDRLVSALKKAKEFLG